MSLELESSISLDEVKVEMWDYGSDKAPRPDGLNFAFMKKYWESLKNDIFDFVLDFFYQGKYSFKL